MRSRALVAAAVVLGAPPAAAETTLEIGVRTGYALGFGNRSVGDVGSIADSELAHSQVPLWFDLGARAGPHAFFGTYLQYGVVVMADELVRACDELDRTVRREGGNASCRVHDLRLGAEFHYHFGHVVGSFDPWAGVGFGYEWLSAGVFAHATSGDLDLGATLHGFEFVNLQAGIDVPAASSMTVGPFVAFSFGTFDRLSRSCVGELCTQADSTERLREGGLHHWLFFGIRAEFGP